MLKLRNGTFGLLLLVACATNAPAECEFVDQTVGDSVEGTDGLNREEIEDLVDEEVVYEVEGNDPPGIDDEALYKIAPFTISRGQSSLDAIQRTYLDDACEVSGTTRILAPIAVDVASFDGSLNASGAVYVGPGANEGLVFSSNGERLTAKWPQWVLDLAAKEYDEVCTQFGFKGDLEVYALLTGGVTAPELTLYYDVTGDSCNSRGRLAGIALTLQQ
jgi:hypothetical protein